MKLPSVGKLAVVPVVLWVLAFWGSLALVALGRWPWWVFALATITPPAPALYWAYRSKETRPSRSRHESLD